MTLQVLNIEPQTDEGKAALEEWNEAGDRVDAARAEEEHLTRLLAPFSDNLAYDMNRVISEVKICLQMEIVARFEIGKRLLILREREGATTLSHLLGEYFPGMNRRSAERYMLFARKAAEIPKFRAFANGRDNWSKALTLMSELDETELQALEDGGSVMDMKVDDLDRMSVRELKCRIKKLKKDKEEAVAGATERLRQENEGLKEKVEALEAASGNDFAKVEKLVRQADKKFMDACELIRQVPAEMLLTDKVLSSLLLGIIGKMERVIMQVEQELLEGGGNE